MTSLFNKLKDRYELFTQNGKGQIRFDSSKLQQSLHKVDKLERRFLVWTGKYKTLAEVPDMVGQNVMERTRNKMRIKIANYMMAATVVGCIIMAYWGKQDAKRGVSVTKQNQEWHRQVKEDALELEASKKK